MAVGSSDGAVQEAVAKLRARGVHLDYMRIRAFPFHEEVDRFLAAHELIFVVEQNRDAQLRALLTLETGVEKPRLRSILHYDGMPLAAGAVISGVLSEVEPHVTAAPRAV